jgi:hypothetical protein
MASQLRAAAWSTLFLWHVGTSFECQTTVEATSSSSGSIITQGGLGVQKNIHVGGTATFDGNVEITGTCTGCTSGIYSVSGFDADFSMGTNWLAGTTYESAGITVRSLKG